MLQIVRHSHAHIQTDSRVNGECLTSHRHNTTNRHNITTNTNKKTRTCDIKMYVEHVSFVHLTVLCHTGI